jgi:O-acetyl-ADP-ribose deacetylase (regulator of RNase III)
MLIPAIIAAACFVVGVGLYLYGSRRGSSTQHSLLLLSWLIIALTPVFLVFTFFPSSDVSGKLQGFTFGGAFAAFVFIWVYGSRHAIQLRPIDVVEVELQSEKRRSEELQNQLLQMSAEQAPQILSEQQIIRYRISGRADRQIGIITGDIINVRSVDIWVNSENTNMQMSRFHEPTISAAIRYHGAELSPAGEVLVDTIARELAAKVGQNATVAPASVFTTGAGQLARTNHVKRIVHVAAVAGEPRLGYRPVADMARCVIQALDAAEAEARKAGASSVLLPLFGLGSAKGDVRIIARSLLSSAIDWLRSDRSDAIATVFVLAYRDSELQACIEVLADSDRVSPVKGNRRRAF